MKLEFFKYQGAGNDFIIVDNREQQLLTRKDGAVIRKLCDRRFGIGADGLMLLEDKDGWDFEMVYFNADGGEGTMCGNGGRCLVAFAHRQAAIGNDCRFWAIDGPHEARILRSDWVELKMQDVTAIEAGDGFFVLDTGSPHYVRFVDDLQAVDVVQAGRAVRYSDRFREKGTNVNFVQVVPEGLKIATYERGVENETLACGTGVTAAALAYARQHPGEPLHNLAVFAKGGDLEVRFERQSQGFSQIWLCGPATFVFEGVIEI